MLQSGGLFLLFKTQQYAAKISMQVNMIKGDTPVEHLSMSLVDYRKSITDNKELFYQGKMYDIKSLSFTNDSVNLIVIHDIKEENVLSKIKNLFASQDNTKKSKIPQTLIQLLSLDYIQDGIFCNDFVSHFSITLKHHFSENTITHCHKIILPPPEIV